MKRFDASLTILFSIIIMCLIGAHFFCGLGSKKHEQKEIPPIDFSQNLNAIELI